MGSENVESKKKKKKMKQLCKLLSIFHCILIYIENTVNNCKIIKKIYNKYITAMLIIITSLLTTQKQFAWKIKFLKYKLDFIAYIRLLYITFLE